MSQYTVTHSCGHAETLRLFGRERDRQARISWLEHSGLCSACFAQHRQERQQNASSTAEKWAADNNLPALQGSEKQCAWAETIRHDALQNLQRSIRLALTGRDTLPEERKTLPLGYAELERASADDWGTLAIVGDCLEDAGHPWAACYYAVAWLLQQDQAKWWIDNRYRSIDWHISERAEEPERLARAEAERKASADKKEREDTAKRETARLEAEAALKAKAELAEKQRGWLKRLGELIERDPADLVLLRLNSRYGWRVIINKDSDVYARDHLVDYYPKEGTIKTSKNLVSKKKELTAFCVEFWSLNPEKETKYIGASLFAQEGQ